MTSIGFIDPGKSSGITWAHYDDETPLTIDGYAQVDGGLLGLLMWLDENDGLVAELKAEESWHAEKFIPYTPHQTLDSSYPLVVEGALVTLGIVPDYEADPSRWHPSKDQYWMPGKKAQERRSAQKKWLRENYPEMYVTGRSVAQKDAEDILSCTFHMLNMLKNQKHLPTLRKFFPEEQT